MASKQWGGIVFCPVNFVFLPGVIRLFAWDLFIILFRLFARRLFVILSFRPGVFLLFRLLAWRFFVISFFSVASFRYFAMQVHLAIRGDSIESGYLIAAREIFLLITVMSNKRLK